MTTKLSNLEIVASPAPERDGGKGLGAASGSAIPEVAIKLSPALIARLRAVLKRHRYGPEPVDNTDTPEMLMLALRREQRHENKTLRQILYALADSPADSIDLDLVAAGERLMRLAQDSPTAKTMP